ncbi:MAG: hypothetical protein SFW67_35980 [Myxococcaceae bacterium]|nr:hypothetical protein [Myxococcaceae bacterium]
MGSRWVVISLAALSSAAGTAGKSTPEPASSTPRAPTITDGPWALARSGEALAPATHVRLSSAGVALGATRTLPSLTRSFDD